MNRTRLLLTGGTGFIGRSLLRHWSEHADQRPRQVVVLSRNPTAFISSHPALAREHWLDLRCGDVMNEGSLPTDPFDLVIHAAADSTLGPSLTATQRFLQIVDGTRNTLRMTLASGARRFLYLSSGAVYGSRTADQADPREDDKGAPDPLDAQQAYGSAKRAAEHLCSLAAQEHGLEVVVARCFTFVGQDLPLDAHFAIGNFIRDALWGRSIKVAGTGTPMRSYMDQRDLAVWLIALLTRAPAGRAYNVGSEAALSIRELAQMVRQTLAPDKDILIQSTHAHEIRNRYVPVTMKARSELGLELRFGLEQSIRDAAAAYVARAEGTHGSPVLPLAEPN